MSCDTAYTATSGMTAQPIWVRSFDTSGMTYMNDRSLPSAKFWLRSV